MIAQSIKFKGHDCFKNDWSGLDAFLPITDIIGRNNTGKSQLLELLAFLTDHNMRELQLPILGTGTLDRKSLQAVFQESTRGGELGGNHWDDHGRQFLNTEIQWCREEPGGEIELTPFSNPTHYKNAFSARKEKLHSIAANSIVPYHGKEFRRILADRDIQPEAANNELELKPDGSGATNIIRRVILASSPETREELIQRDVLRALSDIFGEDADFNRIDVKHHEEKDLWEVYLGEPRKGLVALSRSGSGLKTVVLILLNLLVIPELEKKPKGNYVLLSKNLRTIFTRRFCAASSAILPTM